MITSSTLWLFPTILIKRIIPAVVLPTRMLPERQRSGAMYFQDIMSLQSAKFMFCSLLLWSRPFSLPTKDHKNIFHYQLRCVWSDSLTSSGNNYNFDKVFDLFPHNMFWRLAPCSIIEYIPPPGTTGPTDISKIAFIHNCLALSQFLGHLLGTQRPQ